MNKILLSVGNIYLETNFLGIRSNNEKTLVSGKEYSADKYETLLGGSAVNFATQIRKLGMPIGVLGKTGDDGESQKVLSLMEKAGIDAGFVKKEKGVQTNYAFGVVFDGDGDNIQFAAGSANQTLSLDDVNLDSGDFNDVSAVYFGGSFKQKNLWPHYPSILEKLQNKNIKIYLDHGRVPVDATEEWISIVYKALPFVDGYFLNEDEVRDVTKESDVEKALLKLKKICKGFVALKLGPGGCRIEQDQSSVQVGGHKVTSVNTVGAGDAFNAGFIYKMLSGGNIKEAAEFANATAALKVSLNHQPTQKEVDDFLSK